MCRIGSVLTLMVLLGACQTGYLAVVRVNTVPAVDHEVIDRLQQEFVSKGFRVVASGVADHDARGVSTIAWQYLKADAADERRAILLDLVYAPSRTVDPVLNVTVTNKKAGKDPTVKAQVKDVASACFNILASAYGRVNVEMFEWETGFTPFH